MVTTNGKGRLMSASVERVKNFVAGELVEVARLD
jgi:hypothetical protein